MANVQFIAYQLQTAAEGNTNRQRYPGLSDQKRDIEARCKIMADAVEAADKSSRIDSMATKIFVAPEFFFRGGTAGVYDAENVSLVNETMDRYVADPKYTKWIFVLGTTLAVMPGGGNNAEIMNIAIVRKGGKKIVKSNREVQKTDHLTADDTLMVYKEYVSAIDFLGTYFGDSNHFHGDPATAGKANIMGQQKILQPASGARPTGYVGHPSAPNLHAAGHVWRPSVKLRAFILDKFNKGLITSKERDRLFNMNVQYTTSEQSPTGLGGGTNFSIGGLKFVLEICLDHLQHRAEGTVNPATVDIHLVTSCGMDPNYGHVKIGGYFFLVDGITHRRLKVTLCQRTATGWSYVDPVATLPMTDSSRWKNHTGQGLNLFQQGKGTVYVFPKVTIP